MLFKITKQVIAQIDDFLNIIDIGGLVFKEGITNYLNGKKKPFSEKLNYISELESKADTLRRKIENTLYIHSLVPEFRGDVLKLLEMLDNLIDATKEALYMLEVEAVKIPQEIDEMLVQLSEANVQAIEFVMSSAKSFFRDVRQMKEKIHRVYYYEKEADRIAKDIKKMIFHDMKELSIAEKLHLRDFVAQVEKVSDNAEDVADLLSILAIKRME